MKVGPHVQEAILGIRAWVNNFVDYRWDNAPFGTSPHGTRDEYLNLFRNTRIKTYPQIDDLEETFGFQVDREWLDELALHTQIVKKKSDLAYPHGRLLYSLLRHMISRSSLKFVSILETGTARGFSAVCMAKALEDSAVDGRIVTVDVLSHLKPQIWNCIDDHDGPKSRADILAPWNELCRKIVFLQGDTLYTLGMDRINFAFLDAQHIEASVLHEFETVAARQETGDMIVFDDVISSIFPGVAKAVDRIEAAGDYEVERLGLSQERAYAWASKR